MFNAFLVNMVIGYGLEQYKTDPCMFRLVDNESVIMMAAVHVDDLIVVGGRKRLLSSTTL